MPSAAANTAIPGHKNSQPLHAMAWRRKVDSYILSFTSAVIPNSRNRLFLFCGILPPYLLCLLLHSLS